MQKGQTAIEFLTTYGFSFLLIAIVLTLILLFSTIPKSNLPIECSFYSGFTCLDVVYFTYGTGSQFVVEATDSGTGIINISNFSANIGYAQSANGFCTPSVVRAGQTVYCLANITVPATLGQIYSGTFHITADYCASGTSSIENTTCTSNSVSNSIIFAGQTRLQGSAYNPADLPPLQDVFCVGGSNGNNYEGVYYSAISGLSGSTATNWILNPGPSYPTPMSGASCSIYRNYIYCVGTSQFGSGQLTYYAALQSNGIASWNKGTKFPVIMENAGCSTYQSHIYCVGDQTAPQNQVYYAPIGSNGIGNWVQTANYPIPFYDAGCSIYNGYLYCVGSASGNQAYYSPITSNGIGSWTPTSNYPLPVLAGAACSIYNGYIYCVGGVAGSGNSVYYAPITATGIGQWQATTPYPFGLNIGYNECFIANDNMYCVGSGVAGRQVYYAPVTSFGIGPWKAGATYPTSMYTGACAVPGSSGGFLGGGGSPIT